MDWQGWFTIAIVLGIVGALIRGIAAPDLVLMAGLFALAAVGILEPGEVFRGFSNQSMAAVGALFIVSAGLRQTGALDMTLGRLFGRTRSERSMQARLLPAVSGLSAFLNNAPIVAMTTPLLLDWGRRQRVAPSRLLIPLSYAAILGSTTTVIGTSVNLTAAALVAEAGMEPLAIFEFLPVGLPICAVGLVYLLWVVPRLVPDRRDPTEQADANRREYTAAMLVEPHCPLVGRSVEEAGLRQLEGLFLVEIDRDGQLVTPVGPEERIHAGDRLVFAGVVSTLVDLQRIRGLVAVDQADEPESVRARRPLVEAVVSSSSPLVQRSIRDAQFRTVYDAAVVAVHRNGERVGGKIGEIVLRPGDVLLLQTAPGFSRAHRNSRDFYLVSEVAGSGPPRHDRAWVALAVVAAMVAAATYGLFPISIAAFLAVGVLIGTRCITGPQARRSVEWSVLVVIAAGLGIAHAMAKTGAAEAIAGLLVSAAGPLGPWATLAAVYLVSLLLAELLHHNAGVAIMFPIAVSAAQQVGADPRGFVLGIAVASTCAFASPVSYQTHLIVYGPGGYRYLDFVRTGLPLDALAGAVALTVIPFVWPL